jgi:flagellin
MGYLETGMRVLDAASSLLSRLQELAVLGANETNTTADANAIDFEAEAIGDEFNRLMTNSTYKGKNVFVSSAGSEYVSLGGRDAEMTFGIGTIVYTELYDKAGNETGVTATKAGRVYLIDTNSDDASEAGGPAFRNYGW